MINYFKLTIIINKIRYSLNSISFRLIIFYSFIFQVSEEDQDTLIETKNKSIDISINEKSSKGSLDDDDKESTDDKSYDMKTQEEKDQLELLKQKSEEASKTIERLKMQLQQQSDYEALKREVL